MTEKEKHKRAKMAAMALAAKRGYIFTAGLPSMAREMLTLSDEELKRIAGQRFKKKHKPAPHKMRGDPKRVLDKTSKLFEDEELIDFIADFITDDPDIFSD
jgi:hypothetical protein